MISKWSNYLNERWRQRFGSTVGTSSTLGGSTTASWQSNGTGYPWLRSTSYPGYYSGNGAAGAISGPIGTDVRLYSTGATAGR